VPFLSALKVVYDDALYKSTFTLLILLHVQIKMCYVSCVLRKVMMDRFAHSLAKTFVLTQSTVTKYVW